MSHCGRWNVNNRIVGQTFNVRASQMISFRWSLSSGTLNIHANQMERLHICRGRNKWFQLVVMCEKEVDKSEKKKHSPPSTHTTDDFKVPRSEFRRQFVSWINPFHCRQTASLFVNAMRPRWASSPHHSSHRKTAPGIVSHVAGTRLWFHSSHSLRKLSSL